MRRTVHSQTMSGLLATFHQPHLVRIMEYPFTASHCKIYTLRYQHLETPGAQNSTLAPHPLRTLLAEFQSVIWRRLDNHLSDQHD